MMMIALFLLMHSMFNPPRPPQNAEDVAEKDIVVETFDPELEAAKETPTESPGEEIPLEHASVEPGWATLGSLDPDSPYRMLITLTNKGAAVSRIELNDPKYRDVQDYTGYLGQIVADISDSDDLRQSGCEVQVVGPGTPAEKAGLQVNDRIVGFTRTVRGRSVYTPIHAFPDLRRVLLETRPGEKVDLDVLRASDDPLDWEQTDATANTEPSLQQGTERISVMLGESPISIVRPIGTITTFEQYQDLRGLNGYEEQTHDQLSYLCTLSTIDQFKLGLPKTLEKNQPKHSGVVEKDPTLETELRDVQMRKGLWELVESTENHAVYRMILPKWKLEITKTFRLAQRNDESDRRTQGPMGAYHLHVELGIKNLDSKAHKVAYLLDGPTGMPLEGGWYPRKTGPGWSGYGIRDLVVKFRKGTSQTLANTTIANDKFNNEPWKDDLLDYVGIDTQYFQSTLLPHEEDEENIWHSRTLPIRVGDHNTAWSQLTDISFRTYSSEVVLQPRSAEGEPSDISRSYTIFAGPKNPALLKNYGLENTISYGWFKFIAVPMLAFLHFIKSYVVFHYGLAIIVLTVCVRLLMFPMSRKQAINAAKQAKLAPEMQLIREKYKNDNEAQLRAQQELWKKHNFNPLSGCLGIFIQLPIFIGLYKSLSVDVELYGAPLISRGVRWCSDLSAPDMLFDWSGIWNAIGWTSFNTGQGAGFFSVFCLGPYFNLLPMLTITLFIIQQKIMMPPATDDNMRMQQNMMKYMMIFMGFLFFKVPSGLCIYFIASTLWGLAERKLVPKYEHNLTGESEAPDPEPKTPVRKEKHPIPTEKEQMGTLSSMWKKINEKATEPRTLQKSEKKRKKSGKKKK